MTAEPLRWLKRGQEYCPTAKRLLPGIASLERAAYCAFDSAPDSKPAAVIERLPFLCLLAPALETATAAALAAAGSVPFASAAETAAGQAADRAGG